MNLTNTLTAFFENYNAIASDNNYEPLLNSTFNYTVEMPCTIVGFIPRETTYGKWENHYIDRIVIMEFEHFLQEVSNYLPVNETTNTTYNADLLNYMQTNISSLYQFTDFFYYTLPHPRYSYYQSQNFDTMKTQVTTEVAKIVDQFGFYPEKSSVSLLDQLEDL